MAIVRNARDLAEHECIAVRIPTAARMIGISRSKFYELLSSGDIEAVKLGRSTLIPVASLKAFIEALREP
ncbi:helix-turn-helix domain-containing protein [Sphingomonas sp. LB-2]|uniref:helix-turn-helix domain-containing protein n=1 Tax=Sphingomonas caeni TaxID=2984949 RepID=UPI0022301F4F|nr:helix-turn-helix domain-containing protein [Sphingomonas caeni]MCW3845976.1 helix-turn-helix domain-containing protein [Sphingomonas caeni]